MPTDQIFQTKSTGSNLLNIDSQNLPPQGLASLQIIAQPSISHKFCEKNNGDGRPTVYLIVTVDTEEDQWGPGSDDVTVRNISRIPRLQSLFDKYGVLPTYLVTFPVATSDDAMNTLKGILNDGCCEIGSHLHPWNTPPMREEITNKSTMLANLPYELQLEKIAHLTDFLAHQIGRPPTSFRAGRWGLGNDTIRGLIACNYAVDSSVTPFVSWKVYEGPAFDGMPFVPFLMHEVRKAVGKDGPDSLLEIPATIGYNRWPFEKYRHLEVILDGLPTWSHAKGVAARLNVVRKIWLSPEIDNATRMIVLSRLLIEGGVRVLNMTFHSSSLMPGLTPLVTSEDDLERFYQRLTDYFDGLYRLADVKPMVLSEMAGLITGTGGLPVDENEVKVTTGDQGSVATEG